MDSDVNTSRHVVSRIDQEPSFINLPGSIVQVEKRRFPRLHHLSMRRLILSPGGGREPHRRANTHEFGYCVRGDARLTIVGDHGIRSTFTIGAGDRFFLASGTLHNIENIGDVDAEFILAFFHEKPEDFGLPGAFDAMPGSVLANSPGVKAGARLNFARVGGDQDIFSLETTRNAE